MMADEEVTNMMVRADSFLPEGKLRMPDGEIRDLLDTDFRMEYDGDIRQGLAWVEAKQYGLDACPMCEKECPEGAFVLITDIHVLYPCWVCNKLIEKKTTNEEMEEEWQ